MRIIKAPDSRKNKYREIANKGCDICPYCNSTEEQINYLGEKPFTTTASNGLRFYKTVFVAAYKCENCGAEWESDPY